VAAATVTGPEAHRKEVRPTLFHLCFFLSTALFFILLSVLVPGMSTRFRHQCWLTAAVAFYSASVIARRLLWSSLCSLGLATSQQYFSLGTNQPPAISQQYFSLFGWAATGWAGPAAGNQPPQPSTSHTSATSQFRIQTAESRCLFFKFWRQTH
jgi:hypothetical protein